MLPQTTQTSNPYDAWTDGFREVMAELSDPNACNDPATEFPWWTDLGTWELGPEPEFEPSDTDWAEYHQMMDAIDRNRPMPIDEIEARFICRLDDLRRSLI